MAENRKPRLIRISKDFAEAPGPLYLRQGDGSGEHFRVACLWPALQENWHVRIELDGVQGYSTAFIEEAFGGLIREHPELADSIKSRLEIVGSNTHIVNRIWEYIDEASEQL